MKKKIVTLICLFVALVVVGEIVRFEQNKIRTLEEGEKMPSLVVANNDSTVDLSDFGGKYLLVDFWSSADGASRVASNRYNALQLENLDNVEHISVNLDDDRRLFDEIVSRDRLNVNRQYYAGVDRRILRDFGLEDGYKSYLVDPAGRVLKVNPDVGELMEFFRLPE